MNGKIKGYALGAVAAATYGMNPLFALPLYADGMSPASVLFFRYLLAIPVLGAMVAWRRQRFGVTLRQGASLAAMGLVFALSSLLLFMSYNYMSAGIASTLLFVYPIMVAVIMTCVYGERLTLSTALCILIALSGIALLYRGDGHTTLSLAGTAMVFGSSLSYAVYLVYISRSQLDRMPTVKVTFYVLAFGWLLFPGVALAEGGINTPSQPWLWADLFGLAVFPTAISLLCTTRAIHYIGSTPTAILGALEPVTAVVIGILVFGERLTPRDCLGILLIILAVSLVVAGSASAPLLLRIRKLFPRRPRKARL